MTSLGEHMSGKLVVHRVHTSERWRQSMATKVMYTYNESAFAGNAKCERMLSSPTRGASNQR